VHWLNLLPKFSVTERTAGLEDYVTGCQIGGFVASLDIPGVSPPIEALSAV